MRPKEPVWDGMGCISYEGKAGVRTSLPGAGDCQPTHTPFHRCCGPCPSCPPRLGPSSPECMSSRGASPCGFGGAVVLSHRGLNGRPLGRRVEAFSTGQGWCKQEEVAMLYPIVVRFLALGLAVVTLEVVTPFQVRHPVNATVLRTLKSTAPWRDLDTAVLRELSRRLKSIDHAALFISVWNKEGMTPPKIAMMNLADPIDDESVEFAFGLLATKLVSYANALARISHKTGESGLLSEAVKVAELATIIKPNLVAAFVSLMVYSAKRGDCSSARNWASRVLALDRKKLAASSDIWEKGAGETIEDAKQIAEKVLQACGG